MTISRNLRGPSACVALSLFVAVGWSLSTPTALAQDADQPEPPIQSPVIADLEDGSSILIYHRFGEQAFPTTNTTLAQTDAHIRELSNGSYTPLALPEIVRRLKTGEKFPEKSYGVSIDDAYLSVYTEAWPRFKKAGIPFTVFVATDPIDSGYAHYMSWDQIREMAADPMVTIGSQTASHLHMIDVDATANRADIDKSNQRFKEELGFVPDLIAYPYGEFNDDAIAVSRLAGFKAGFGQHSGAFGSGDDVFRLPRFAMNETYGDVARLRTAAGALPIVVSDLTPTDTVVTPDNNPPAVGFTLSEAMPQNAQIACYSNQEGKLSVERLGPRVEVRMNSPLPKGRTRINCTMPVTDPNGEVRWRWLGKLLYVK
ncbi:MAG TPA: polysaccharide deacetylase family protein [Magnetovibrio sp.]